MSTEPPTPQEAADRAEAILERIVKVKGGTRRDGQVLMARTCAESMAAQTPLLLEGPTGVGKALAETTPIPTPRGFVPMGELKVGDVVYDERGHLTRVTEVFEVRHDRPCYRVTFSDGTSIVADEEHEWDTLTAHARRRAGGDAARPSNVWEFARTVTTGAMRESLMVSGSANHQVPLAQPLAALPDLPELPLHPYTLGVWLFAARPRYREQAVRLSAIAGQVVPGFERVDDTSTVYEPTEQTVAALDALGVLDDRTRIPDAYLFHTRRNREQLLAGIVDVAGDVNIPTRSRGQVRVSSRSASLLDSLRSLLAALGVRASRGGASFGGDSARDGGGYVTYSPSRDPFLLAQAKKERLGLPEAIELGWRTRRRSIVSITPVESVPVRCISVDSPSRLYLAGTSMIPTHNSIGYLAGSLAFGKSVVVAPHTKALQDQLVADLDLLAEAYDPDEDGGPLDHAPTYTVIKGRASYVCLNKLAVDSATEGQGELVALADAKGAEASEATSDVGAQVAMIHEWAKGTDSGDRSDLPEQVSNKVWSTVSVTSDECLGKQCGFAQECFANKARDKASDSDVIITNHKFLTMAMKIPDLFPEGIGGVVVDESHELASTVSETFGAELSKKRFEGVLKAAKPIGDASKNGAEVIKDTHKLLDTMDALPAPRGDDREHPVKDKVVTFLTAMQEKFAQLSVRAGYLTAANEEEKAALDAMKRSISNVRSDISLILEGQTDTQVVWTSKDERGGGLVFHAAQFDSSETIFKYLLARYKSVVFTSATLTIANSFDLTATEHGFGLHGSPYRWQSVPSPFRYAEQAKVYYPPNMPNPTDRSDEGKAAYFEAVGREALKCAIAANGRTLVLCSSRASVEAVSEFLREHLPESNALHVQTSESSPKHLAEAFASDPHSVLVGTRSFWTGISVEGDTNAATVIDKMPFPPPTDPIIAARTDKADMVKKFHGFNTVSVPEAIRQIVQGAGREIRTINDRGVVVICDPRIAPSGPHSKGYGAKVRKSLPPFTQARSWDEVERFLRHIDETARDDERAAEVVVEDEGATEDGGE